jgi:hypothetical protein
MSDTDNLTAETSDNQAGNNATSNTKDDSGSLLNVKPAEKSTAKMDDLSAPHLEVDPNDKAQEVDSAEELDFVRPEFFPENFWDEESGPDVEGLAKAYSELRAKMSAGKHKAPKDGKYEITSLKDRGVADDDPMLKDFVGLAKEQGLSQEQFDQMIDLYTGHMGAMEDQIKTSRDAEMKKLGRNADKIVQSTEQWLTKMQTSGTLNQDEIEAIGRASNNASFISALHKIRGSYMETDIPGLEMQENQKVSLNDVQSMMADPKYGKDPAYTKKVEDMVYSMYGEGSR